MGVVRLQVEVDEEVMTALDELGESGGLRTRKDLINNAFTLLKWAVEQRAKGHTIASVNEQEGVYKELEMPFLDLASRAARKKLDEELAQQGSSKTARNPLPFKQARPR